MKLRTAKPKSAYTFVDVEQPGMIVARSLEDPTAVAGAYVKVAPTLRTSERGAFDSKGVRERLLAAGAVAVVVAPVVVPDSVEDLLSPDRPAALVRSAEEHLREWLEGVKGASILVLERALRQALESAGEAGL